MSSKYLKSELGGRRHKILKAAGWKYVKGSGDVYAVYKRDDYKIWVNKKLEWRILKKQERKIKWSTILKKYL